MRSHHMVRAVATLLLLGALSLSGTASYTVQAGDTLSDIASRFGVSVQSLASRNRISDVHYIRTGSVLDVPGSSSTSASSSSSSGGTVRTVRSGETLLEISIETGVL